MNGPPREPLDNDDDVLDAFRQVAAPTLPSPFHTARAARACEAALDAEMRSRTSWTWRGVAAVAAVAACAGAATAVVMRPSPAAGVVAARLPAPAPIDVTAPPPGNASVVPAASAPTADAAPAAPVLAVSAASLPTPPKVAAAARVISWRDEAQALVDAGDGAGAVRVLVRALATDESAAVPLALVARRFPGSLDPVDAELALIKSPEAMRIRCEQKLLLARDRAAVDACRAFGQEHPEHPGARTLAFAAGRVAEDDLADLALAEEEYSRALLLSPFVGLPGTDALLARARVREARSEVDEARADLRLYLHNVPAGRDDPAVKALMAKLALP